MTRQLLFVVALVGAASPALAQNPKFEFGKAEEVEKVKDVEWTASAEVGLVFTTGNSDTTTISAGARATRKTGKNKFSAESSLTYARSSILVHVDDGDGLVNDETEIATQTSTTAETVMSKLRYDRFLTKYNSLFVAALLSRDLPAGKESVFGGQIGYSRLLYQKKDGDKTKAEAVAEIGYDFSRENLTAGSPVSIHSARGFVGYKAEMTEGTNLETSVEALTNVLRVTLPTGADGGPGKDTRVNFKVAISSKIGKSLAIQTSIEAKIDARPAPLVIPNAMLAPGFVPEAATTDTIMKASLIYNFF
jgi:hypothetical protein